MAKDKKKKKKDKLPKEIAGVKVPKELRKPAAKAKKLLEDHPVISEAVAAGMIAAAAALMDDKQGKKASAVLKAAAGAMGGHLMGQAKDKLGVKPSKPKPLPEASEDAQPA
jgi:hypothetical protein